MARPDLDSDARKLGVLVVDDHDVVHWGFRLMLTQQPWVERCLSARTGDEALALAERYSPHVALVDLFIGDESGPDVCGRLRELSPQTRVLLISGAGRISPQAARAAGAAGRARRGAAPAGAGRRRADARAAGRAAGPPPPGRPPAAPRGARVPARARVGAPPTAGGATNAGIGRGLSRRPTVGALA